MITCHRTRRREAIRHNEASNTTKQSIKYNVMLSLLGLRHKWWNKDRNIFSLHRLGSLSGFTRANAHWGWWAIFHPTVNSLFQKNKVNTFLQKRSRQKKGYIFAFLRWLDWIFWGWYLPSLSINYVGMSKDMEKRLPQLYYIKMKIFYDLGFIAIGVAMAT